jgi:hypothetical protein
MQRARGSARLRRQRSITRSRTFATIGKRRLMRNNRMMT